MTLEIIKKKTIIDVNGCWIWQYAKNKQGYGLTRDGVSLKRAHRSVFESLVGPIPKGLLVLHRCDNPSCVRPSHLFLGTHKDNTQDCIKKGRRVANQKLSKWDKETIRRAYPTLKMIQLSRIYKVHIGTISKIISSTLPTK